MHLIATIDHDGHLIKDLRQTKDADMIASEMSKLAKARLLFMSPRSKMNLVRYNFQNAVGIYSFAQVYLDDIYYLEDYPRYEVLNPVKITIFKIKDRIESDESFKIDLDDYELIDQREITNTLSEYTYQIKGYDD